VISVSPTTDNIQNYLEMRLDRDFVPETMGDDSRTGILRVILEKIPDMYCTSLATKETDPPPFYTKNG